MAAAAPAWCQPTPDPPGTAAIDQPIPELPADDPLPPTGIEEELSQLRPGVALKRELDRIAEETNIRFGLINTYLFQHASAGEGDRTAGGGDLDLLAKWTAIGKGTKDTGILAAAAEYRYQIGSQAPAALGGQIGTLLPTTNGFGERPVVLKEAYWDQRLFEDHLRFGLGRIDPENMFGGHKLQSASTFFLYKAFSSNPTVAYPGPGAAAAVQVKPVSWMYAGGGISDANGKATVGNLEGFLDDHEFLTWGEAGVTPDIEGVGAGRYRLGAWHIDEREAVGAPSDEGLYISCDQDLGEVFTVFARYGHAEGDVTNVTDSVQGGTGIKNVLGAENLFGIAGAWSQPADESLRDEKVIEAFQRFQITETIQFTLDVEVIFDPSNAPGDDMLGVLSARVRFAF